MLKQLLSKRVVIFKNGSYFIFNENGKTTLRNAFGESLEQGDFIPDIISRKKQIVPPIMSVLK